MLVATLTDDPPLPLSDGGQILPLTNGVVHSKLKPFWARRLRLRGASAPPQTLFLRGGAVHICYLDESGVIERGAGTSHFVLLGLAFPPKLGSERTLPFRRSR